MIPPLKLCEEQLLTWKICCRIGSTVAVKSGWLGVINGYIMAIFSADTWFLSNRLILLEEEIMHFFWSLKYWNWFCYQIWLSKMYNKN